MIRTLYLHLGLPKTATTTLQTHIFPNHDSYLYIDKNPAPERPDGTPSNAWLRQLRINLIQKEIPYFEKNAADIITNLAGTFGQKAIKDSKILLSDEGIIARCLSPSHYEKMPEFGSAYGVLAKLKVISETSNLPIKIIIVIRRQDDLIHSFFAEDYKSFNSILGFQGIEDYVNYLYHEGADRSADSIFDYYSFIKRCDYLFGHENVLILPYEALAHDPMDFFSAIAHFMEIRLWDDTIIKKIFSEKENIRALKQGGKVASAKPTALLGMLLKIKRQVFGKSSWGLFPKKVIAMKEKDRQKIQARYYPYNKLLVDRVPSIANYGYF